MKDLFLEATEQVGFNGYSEKTKFEEFKKYTIVKVMGGFPEDVLLIVDRIKELTTVECYVSREAGYINVIMRG